MNIRKLILILDHAIIGSILSAGSSLVGGFLGHKSDQRTRSQQAGQFDAQMDESIQRRVADAKKAGVHPLYALGASVGASPTITAGSNALGRGIAAAGKTIGQSALLSAQIEAAKGSANKDNAIANLENTRAAMIKQGSISRGRDMFVGPPVDAKGIGGHIVTPPRVHASRGMGVEAGDRPKDIVIRRQDGSKFTIPSPELNQDEVAQVIFAAKEISHYTGNVRHNVTEYIRKHAYLPKGVKRKLKWLANKIGAK